MSQDKDLLVNFEAEYSTIAPLAKSLCTEIITQLEKLLSDAGIILGFPIQWRVKSWNSISEKFYRLSLSISSLSELQDIAGLRLILMFRKDVQTVVSIIERHFTVIRQYDTTEKLQEDQFGYSSQHMIVSLPETWTNVPTMAKLKNICAEIQIRTVAQHIWAEASRLLQYKHEQSVPKPVRRSIHRVSALLETVDFELNRLVDERSWYRESINLEDRDEQLNSDLLEKLLDRVLPIQNKEGTENYSELLQELNAFKITTVRQMEKLWGRHSTQVLLNEKELLQKESERTKHEGAPLGTSIERLGKGVFFNHEGLIRNSLRNEFGKEKEYDDYLTKKLQKKTAVKKR